MIRVLCRLSLALVSAMTLAAGGLMLRSLAVPPHAIWRAVAGFVLSWLLTSVSMSLAAPMRLREALAGKPHAEPTADRYWRDAVLLSLAGSLCLIVGALWLPPDLLQGLLARLSPGSFRGGAADVPLSAARFAVISAAFGLTTIATIVAMVAEAVLVQRRRGLTRRQAGSLVAAVYAGLACWTAQAQSLTGDEPHYLIAARSLLDDGDLDLANDYAEHRYGAFWPSDTLRRALAEQSWRRIDPHAVRLDDGRVRPVHQIGLSLLVLPGFALLGWPGAVLTALAIGVLAALQAARLTWTLDDSAAGWLAAAALVFGSPLLTYSASLHTEPACALILGYLAWLAVGGAEARRWPAAVALFCLPWLHWKAVPVGLLLACFVLADDRRAGRAGRWWPLVGLAAGAIGQTAISAALYGSVWPDAPQRLSAGRFPGLFSGNPVVGLPGLLVDQQDGLLIAWPLALLIIPCIALRLRGAPHRRLLAAVGLQLVLVAWYALWGSGHAPAGRQLLPVVPLLGPFVAAGARWMLARRGLALLVAWNVTMVVTLALLPRLRYPDGAVPARHPVAGLLGADWLDVVVPAVRTGPAAVVVGWAWLLLLAAWGAMVAPRGYDTLTRRRRERKGAGK